MPDLIEKAMPKLIKFRGVQVDNGEFVFGDLLQQPTCRIVNADGEFEIKPESVAQFIGYDADGHELYTGDRVTCITYIRNGTSCIPFELAAIRCDSRADLMPRIINTHWDWSDKSITEFKYCAEEDISRWEKDRAYYEREYKMRLKKKELEFDSRWMCYCQKHYPDGEVHISKKAYSVTYYKGGQWYELRCLKAPLELGFY